MRQNNSNNLGRTQGNQGQNNVYNDAQNNNNNQNNSQISLIFKRNKKKKGEDFQIAIYCSINDKLRDVTKRYLTKVMEEEKNVMFFFNGKRVNQSLTVAESGMIHLSTIFAVDVDLLEAGN